LFTCARCGLAIGWLEGATATPMNPYECPGCGAHLHSPWTRWWLLFVLVLPVALYFPAAALQARGYTGERSAYEVVFAIVTGLAVGFEVMAWQVGTLAETSPAQRRNHRILFGLATLAWLAVPVAQHFGVGA
jgi:hypothetical protein